jgi:hypothetical protein
MAILNDDTGGLEALIGSQKAPAQQPLGGGFTRLLHGETQDPPINNMFGDAPDEISTQFGQLVDQFGPPPESVVRDLATIQQRQRPAQQPIGGGLFDAYSQENQGNLKMAMFADIIGNLAGRDVGATKGMLALAENARKLRLQQEENAAYDNVVSRFTPHQKKFLDSLPVSMRKMAIQQLLEQQFAVKGREGPLVSVGMGDKIGVKAFENMSSFMKASGVKKEAAYNNLRESEVMLTLMRERNPETGKYVMTTGPGQEGWTRAQAFFVNALESFGTKGMQEHFSGLKGIVGRKQFFDSVSKSKTLLKAALMKGNLSEKELDFSTDTVAHLLRGRYSNILTAELSKIAEETEYNRAVHLDNWYSANLAKYKGNLAGMDAALRNEVNSWNAADRKEKVGHMTDLIARLDVESRAAENFVVTPTAGADSNSWQTEMTMDQLRDRAAKSRPNAQ